jgi:hypothetical protein
LLSRNQSGHGIFNIVHLQITLAEEVVDGVIWLGKELDTLVDKVFDAKITDVGDEVEEPPNSTKTSPFPLLG